MAKKGMQSNICVLSANLVLQMHSSSAHRNRVLLVQIK